VAHEYGPDWASPPGVALEEWRARQRVSRRTLAELLELSEAELSELLTGRRELTLTLVLKLQDVTGIPRRMWATMEALYRAEQARSQQLKAFNDRAAPS
jgi:plasmid maintenance system antidote protein VapI